MITVLNDNKITGLDVDPGKEFWLSADDTAVATGWTLKPEGLCKDEMCVPIPAGRQDEFSANDKVNVSAFWQLMGKPLTSSNSNDVWSLGEAANDRNESLRSLKAPNFSLPDFDGNYHSLTDFQRKKVLLITWASW